MLADNQIRLPAWRCHALVGQRPGTTHDMMQRLKLAVVMTLAVLTTKASQSQTTETYEQPPINYSATPPRDALAQVQTRLAAGELKLTGNGKEIVRSLLRELHIPVESQLLVFSKTSFQRHRIRPDHPRALYFSDTCYVGWLPVGFGRNHDH